MALAAVQRRFKPITSKLHFFHQIRTMHPGSITYSAQAPHRLPPEQEAHILTEQGDQAITDVRRRELIDLLGVGVKASPGDHSETEVDDTGVRGDSGSNARPCARERLMG
jgi:hypothetical protein